MSDAEVKKETVPMPPQEVAGLDPVVNEPEPDEGLYLPVRDRRFKLRNGIPGVLVGRITKTAQAVGALNLGERDPSTYTESERRKIQAAIVASFDGLTKLIVEDERDGFIEWCEDVDPVLGDKEQGELLATALETITGRPTGAS